MSKKFTSSRPIRILYEDEQFVAFFKPAGLLTVPMDKAPSASSLTDLVNAQMIRAGMAEGARLHPCHRLDRDTSGVILFAKSRRAEEFMIELFRQRQVKKKYIAFVHGRLLRPRGEIRSRLDEDRHSRDPQMISITRYQLRKQCRQFAVVEVEPLTGRTNQIRIHFSRELKNPLVGDSKFAFRKDFDLKFKRTALHAFELYFKHPVTGAPVSISAPLALDMQNFLDKNRT